MKTLSSPLPIPADHNPFDFYSHRGDKQQGLERQESKQPTTRSVNDHQTKTETKTKTDRTLNNIFTDLGLNGKIYLSHTAMSTNKQMMINAKKLSLNTFKVAEIESLGQRQWKTVCSEASPGDNYDDCMLVMMMMIVC